MPSFRWSRLCLALSLSTASLGAQARDTMSLVTSGKGALNFLAMGDWGRNGESPQKEVAGQLGDAARALNAQFLLVLGDNFYPAGVQSVSDPQWTRSLENVYSAFSLNAEWYVALGNHDYRGEPQAQVEYSRISRRWRMPSRYYSVKKEIAPGATVEFLIIDTSPFIKDYRKEPDKYHMAGTDTAKQRKWIDSTLKASKAQWKIIVGHHNVYSGGVEAKRTVLPDMEALLLPLMRKYGVQVYLCGHEHHLEHIQPEPNGPHFLISGAASEGNDVKGTKGTKFVAAGPGFMALSLTPDSMIVQAIDAKGKLLYRTSIKR